MELYEADYIVGGTAQFSCVPGYKYSSGDLLWTCNELGEWEGEEPICEGIS